MTTKVNLDSAKATKDDEFYTQLVDIEKECSYYKEQFKDKIIYCNCDNYKTSNFVKYFQNNFHELGLKELIATSYNPHDKGVYYSYNGVLGESKELEDNGDFRSLECIGIMLRSDIIVTNPPFSLNREFIKTVISWNKKFLIISSQTVIGYKDIFPLIQNDALFVGMNYGDMKFTVPYDSEPRANRFWIDETGQKWRSLGNTIWLTNLINTNLLRKELNLVKTYDPDVNLKYDNYNGIEVAKINEIPYDYDGVMGVPITFMYKYNSNQFEIVGFRKGDDGKDLCINGKSLFSRILIKRKYSDDRNN